MVPKGWEKRDLQGLINVRHGFAFKSEFFTDRGDYILLTPGSFNESGGFRDQGGKTKYYAGDVPDGYLLKKGDMLLAMTEQAEGLLGSALFVPDNHKYLHNQRLGLVQVTAPEQVAIEFLYLFFNAPATRKQITEQSTGTKVKHTSPDRLCSVIGLIPPLPEQKKIAQVLTTWDKAITTTEQLLANSQQQKKALMQQLLTGKKRLLDKNGVRFSGKWKEIRLKSVLREVKTRNKDNSIERVLSVTNHSGFVLPEDQFSKRVASDDVSNYKVVKNGEYGYNPSRLNVGSFARLDSYEQGLLSPMYVVFSVNEKLLNSNYFMNWMSSNEAKQRISGSTQGSVRDSVGFDSLCGFPFKLPPMEEQHKIAAVLCTADQEISALQQKLDALKQEKKALMQQLLTGKRRVKVEEAA